MAESSTPTNTPASGTVNVEELAMTDGFMEGIMKGLAPGEVVSEKASGDANQEIQKKGETKNEEESNEAKEGLLEEKAEEKVEESTEEVKGTQEENKISSDPYEKRWKDSQAMIGKQSNEIGQLRKQMSEYQNQFETVRKQTQQENSPYYEKLMKASPDEVAKVLGPILGDEFAGMSAKSQANMLQFVAKMSQDIIQDKIKPFEQMVQQNEQQKVLAVKDAEWYSTHPEYKARQSVMSQFIKDTYPDGPIAGGADPYVVAHMAYEYAGKVINSTAQNVEQQNNKRIVNARSADGSTRAVDASASLKQSKPTLDSKSSEINRIFEQQASVLMRSAR